MNNKLAFVSLACLPFLLSGCKITAELSKLTDRFIDNFRTKMPISFMQPAKETGLESIKRIAVIHNQDNSNGASLMETELSEIKVHSSPYFTFVDRKAIEAIIKEQKFADGKLADDNTRVKIGKLTGADTLLSAQFTTNVKKESHYENRRRCDENDCYDVRVRCSVKTASAFLEPRAISVETGQIIFTRRYSNLAEDKVCSTGNHPSDEKLLGQAVAPMLQQLKSDVAPHTVVIDVKLMRSDDSDMPDRVEDIFDLGLDFADKEMFDHACKQFAKAQSLFNQSLAINYNNAVCAERKGDLELAKAYYQTANDLTTDIDDISWITDGNDRILQQQQSIEKLESLSSNGRI